MNTHCDYDNHERFNYVLGKLLPFGVSDTSWKNDACPSIGVGNVRLFVNYSDPLSREMETAEFSIVVTDDDGSVIDHYEFDDANETVAAFINEVTA